MMATLALLALLGGFLLVLSSAAGGPVGRGGLLAGLAHGVRELDRLSRLYAASVDHGRRPSHR